MSGYGGTVMGWGRGFGGGSFGSGGFLVGITRLPSENCANSVRECEPGRLLPAHLDFDCRSPSSMKVGTRRPGLHGDARLVEVLVVAFAFSLARQSQFERSIRNGVYFPRATPFRCEMGSIPVRVSRSMAFKFRRATLRQIRHKPLPAWGFRVGPQIRQP
jgi:hypothetical protein